LLQDFTHDLHLDVELSQRQFRKLLRIELRVTIS
jgi:hypothetical protein